STSFTRSLLLPRPYISIFRIRNRTFPPTTFNFILGRLCAALQLHLPNLTDLICRLDHRLGRFARKCLGELRHIYDHAVDTIFCRRMWIGNRADTEVFRTLIGARPLSEADEESLIGGEAINGRE